ncbi:hypothetical protein [Bradyrhizobium sp. OAE829]|uniref:hypothetical protein n=1 Tax=Bradyrhizobium sp. OAE829 TaxID=2663807 RepID=UPI00178B6F60
MGNGLFASAHGSRLFFSIHGKLGLAPRSRLQPLDVMANFILGRRIDAFPSPSRAKADGIAGMLYAEYPEV